MKSSSARLRWLSTNADAFAHLWYRDAQHAYGPGSPEALAAIEVVDAHVPQMIDAVNDAGLTDRTDIVVLSDHGFYSGGGYEALLTKPGNKGGHGFAPTRPELQARRMPPAPDNQGRD